MYEFFILFSQVALFLLLMFLFVIVFVYVFSLARTSISKKDEKENDFKEYIRKVSKKEEISNG